MTFSLLARDRATGALGGAAATGNLCVGAWVLRGRAGVGVSASQGHFPSTLWGEHVLKAQSEGLSPGQAIDVTIAPDGGRDGRQLLTLNGDGQGAAFSGSRNLPEISQMVQPGLCAGGNMLSAPGVIKAMVEGYGLQQGSFLRRLLAALASGARAGGDARGLMSAAVLIVSEDHPPLDLRVDFAPDPLGALSDLADRVEGDAYASWMRSLPTGADPFPG